MFQRFLLNKQFLDPRFLMASGIVFVGGFFMNILNYLFTVAMGRMLPVAAFGDMSALFSFLLIMSVPATALTMLMARESSFGEDAAHMKAVRLFKRLQRPVFLSALGGWVFFLGMVPLLSQFLHIAPHLFVGMSFIIPITALTALQSGALQAMQQFAHLAKQNVVGAAMKLMLAGALVYTGYATGGVVVALVCASGAVCAYGYFVLRTMDTSHNAQSTEKSHTENQLILPMFGVLLVTTFCLALLTNIDILLARHYLSAELAGQYSALATMGKIMLFGVGAVTTVLIPMVSAERARGGIERRLLGLSMGITASLVFSVWVLFATIPTHMVQILFGTKYIAIVEHLSTFGIAIACMTLSITLINYFIAIRNISFLYLLGSALMTEALLITMYHATLQSIVMSLLASSALLLVLMSANYLAVVRVHIA